MHRQPYEAKHWSLLEEAAARMLEAPVHELRDALGDRDHVVHGAVPTLSRTGKRMDIGNRFMQIPHSIREELYGNLSVRVNEDRLRGFDLLVCRGCDRLASALLEITVANECGFDGSGLYTGGMSRGIAEVMASVSLSMRTGTWVISIERDTPLSWLRGFIELDVMAEELTRQTCFLEQVKRQLPMEVQAGQ